MHHKRTRHEPESSTRATDRDILLVPMGDGSVMEVRAYRFDDLEMNEVNASYVAERIAAQRPHVEAREAAQLAIMGALLELMVNVPGVRKQHGIADRIEGEGRRHTEASTALGFSTDPDAFTEMAADVRRNAARTCSGRVRLPRPTPRRRR